MVDNWALHSTTAAVIAASGLSGMATLPEVLEIECAGHARFHNLDTLGNESDTMLAIGFIRI